MDPFILTKFMKPDTMNAEDPITSLVVFEWRDQRLLGAIEPKEDHEGDNDVVCITKSKLLQHRWSNDNNTDPMDM